MKKLPNNSQHFVLEIVTLLGCAEKGCFGSIGQRFPFLAHFSHFRKKIAPHQETSNCQTKNKNLVIGSRWESDTKIDWPTDRRSYFNFNFNFSEHPVF
jgi:hypothetical protein